MSWKTSGKLVSGPPSAHPSKADGEAGLRLDQRYRPNLGGRTAWEREREQASRYGDLSRGEPDNRKSEWDVLKENHRFIRDDEEPSDVTWEERLARAYESKLFKEFALIDLKHYKTRRLALRWRTAPEVVEGIGEDTCGSLRCKYHQPVDADRTPGPSSGVGFSFGRNAAAEDENRTRRHRKKRRREMPVLRAYELPFAYEEAGERKEALVKVKLCPRCQAKLTWKPGKADADSEAEGEDEEERDRQDRRQARSDRYDRGAGGKKGDDGQSIMDRQYTRREEGEGRGSRKSDGRRRDSTRGSRSPRRRKDAT